MALFLAKIDLKRPRKRENNNYCSVPFHSVPFHSYPTLNRKFQNNNKKILKTKKYHFGCISSENRLEKDEK